MLSAHRRTVLAAGLLAAVFAIPASAGDAITVQQTAEAAAAAPEMAAPLAAPNIANESYATESTGRPLNPVAGNRARSAVRGSTYSKTYAPHYVDAAARRPCGHLGCRGVHVLGVGF